MQYLFLAFISFNSYNVVEETNMQAVHKPIDKPLTPEETRQVEASNDVLNQLLDVDNPNSLAATLQLSVERADGRKAELLLPGKTLFALRQLLKELCHGKSVTGLSTDSEVTTQQAADFLRVCRPYF